MAYININYNEGGEPLNYQNVTIGSMLNNNSKVFESGDFVKDWFNVIKCYFQEMGDEPLLSSSSVDHFFMDGADYDGAYLHFENDMPVLKYVDRNNKNWYNDPIVEGIELFVEPGTQPTWEELKEYCK
jgi:hypothetical protein